MGLLAVAIAVAAVVIAWPKIDGAPGVDIDRQALALRLEEAGLRNEAIRAWEDHLAIASPGEKEIAPVWYRLGRLAQEEGEYEMALGYFYRAEALSDHLTGNVRDEMGRRVTECLERLGRFGAVAAERVRRTSLDDTGPDRGDVLAVIGKEEIRRKDLDEYLEAEVEAATASLPGLPDEQVQGVRAQTYRRLAAPDVRAARLEEMIAKEVLLRKGMSLDLDRDPSLVDRLDRIRQALIAEEVLRRALEERIRISDGDVRRYHEANIDDYLGPGEVTIRHLLFEDRESAEKHLGEMGEDEGEVLTVREGSEPSDIAHLAFSTPVGEVGSRVARSDQGYHVIRVVSRTPGDLLPFEEVEESVRAVLWRTKQAEVQSDLIRELFEEHGVEIYRDRILEKKDG
jgi:tetratricopeptide (TPR) repeat protein